MMSLKWPKEEYLLNLYSWMKVIISELSCVSTCQVEPFSGSVNRKHNDDYLKTITMFPMLIMIWGGMSFKVPTLGNHELNNPFNNAH